MYLVLEANFDLTKHDLTKKQRAILVQKRLLNHCYCSRSNIVSSESKSTEPPPSVGSEGVKPETCAESQKLQNNHTTTITGITNDKDKSIKTDDGSKSQKGTRTSHSMSCNSTFRPQGLIYFNFPIFSKQY